MKMLLGTVKIFLPLGFISLGYAAFIWGIVRNRLNPTYETALGTAYFAFFGFILVLLGFLYAIVIYRTQPAFRRHIIAAVIAFLFYLPLLLLTDRGNLDVM